MTMGMAGLALCRIAEQARDLRLPFDIGNLREVKVTAIRLAFTGKRGLQVIVSFGSF
jgi:hypothetical protein